MSEIQHGGLYSETEVVLSLMLSYWSLTTTQLAMKSSPQLSFKCNKPITGSNYCSESFLATFASCNLIGISRRADIATLFSFNIGKFNWLPIWLQANTDINQRNSRLLTLLIDQRQTHHWYHKSHVSTKANSAFLRTVTFWDSLLAWLEKGVKNKIIFKNLKKDIKADWLIVNPMLYKPISSCVFQESLCS